MKNYKRYIIKVMVLVALTALPMTSCSDWLTVSPKSEIEASILFETESGFKNALTGIYLNMSETNVYGKELTYGWVDVIAQQYEMESNNSYIDFQNYQYKETDTAAAIDDTWAKMYNIIAHINYLLSQLDENGTVLHPNVQKLIKGECLGLRAFIHFDILRLWGYGDLANTPKNLDKLTIPYVTRFEKHISPQLKESEVLEKIHADLEESQALLEATDEYSHTPKDYDFVLPDPDGYFARRYVHFNYAACRATQARVYLWEGKYNEAAACALEVINKGNSDFPWVTPFHGSDRTQFDILFSCEHIFALNIMNLYKNFEANQRVKINNETNADAFYHTSSRRDELYESSVNMTDFRLEYHYDRNKSGAQDMLKFYQTESYAYRNQMPLIRKSELCYILAECYNRTGIEADRIKGIGYLNQVRNARSVKSLPTNLTEEQLSIEIQKEYQKEFVSEGQLFYFYKRMGMKTIPYCSVDMDVAQYVIPLPDVEMEFGGRIDNLNVIKK